MRKFLSMLLVSLMVLTMLFLFAGCSNEKVEQSKELVAEYYDNFKDNDVKDILDLFDDSFIEYLGSEEEAEIIIGSRIAVLGEDFEYNVYGTSYNVDNGETMVVIEVEVEYDRDGETYDEKFQLEDRDREMLITQVSLEREKVIEGLPQEFVAAYNEGDEDGLTGLFADAYFSYFTEEELYAQLDNYDLVLGSLENIEMNDEYAYCLEVEEDDVVLVQESYYDAQFENGTALLWMQLCLEDGEILIYDIFCIPDMLQDTVDEHYALMAAKDFDGVNGMYLDSFYGYFEGGAPEWTETLQTISDYGEYVDSKIVYWEYYETEMEDGTLLPGIYSEVNSQFGDTVFINGITVSLDPANSGIIDHLVKISE